MSAFETAVNDVAIALDVAAEAQKETGLGGATATAVISVARAAIHALQGIASGNVTAEQVETELARLQSDLASNDLNADAALAAKFPTGQLPP